MKIFVPNEVSSVEKRVALTPEGVGKLLAKYQDLEIMIEKSAGEGAFYADADYEKAGAIVVSSLKAPKDADVVLRVSPDVDAKHVGANGVVIGFLDPASHMDKLEKLQNKGVNLLPVEFIPRTSRAQSMDALSSQANIAGYRAVIESVTHYAKLFPLMMTAAGAAKPAHVIVLGVGVAGLQAIATARRLGAQVSAFDIRPESKEQVESLGAKFLEFDLGEVQETEGGYAKELSESARQKQQELLQGALASADIVITTAQVPGRPAPVLLTEQAVSQMKAGSVVVDMAAGGYNLAHKIKGGNCPLTKADEVITTSNGVVIMGYTNYAAKVSAESSKFYSNNLVNLLNLILEEKDGVTSLYLDTEDDIIVAALKKGSKK